jgi:formate hydrogenlyase subunit 6/NADH:ubiquinone oxidoreductase subunit I
VAGKVDPGTPEKPDVRGQVTDTPRTRLIEVLQRLSAPFSAALPAALFPAIEIADSCRNHRVCSSICPTGALRPYEEGAASGLEFDAQACIACGDCVRGCPEKAIGLIPARQQGSAPEGVERLTRHAIRECATCGSEFASPGGKAICPACEKTKDLFSTGSFGRLFGAPRLAGEIERPSKSDTHSQEV